MLCVTTERLPLRRPRGGRWIGGVCRGLSAHLGMPVGVIRLVMVLLVPVGFTGPLLYVWFWVTVPAADPSPPERGPRPAALSRTRRTAAARSGSCLLYTSPSPRDGLLSR